MCATASGDQCRRSGTPHQPDAEHAAVPAMPYRPPTAAPRPARPSRCLLPNSSRTSIVATGQQPAPAHVCWSLLGSSVGPGRWHNAALQRGCSCGVRLHRRGGWSDVAAMDTHDVDVTVIGAGIAGSTAAAALAADRRVALIEAEEAAGYHSTGRSAAVWILNYGPPDVRTLTGLSRPFFEHPPAGFADVPLMSRRARGVPGAGSAAGGAGGDAGRGTGASARSPLPSCAGVFPRCGRVTRSQRRSRKTRSTWTSRRCIRASSSGFARRAALWPCATVPGGSTAAAGGGKSRPAPGRCSARRWW